LRTNAKGANLNRCWGTLHGITAAGQTDPPAKEVEAMAKGMKALGGPDVLLDIPQDEENVRRRMAGATRQQNHDTIYSHN
jgi:murein tripeptide amidase MpaA